MTLHKCEVSCFWAEPIKRQGHYQTWEKWSIQPSIVEDINTPKQYPLVTASKTSINI
jgi:hypothetical protein